MSPLDDRELRQLAFAARDGDPAALERVVEGVDDDVYRLALRLLWHPEEAKDAAQEALIRIVTQVGSYRGRPPFARGPTGSERTTSSTGARAASSRRT